MQLLQVKNVNFTMLRIYQYEKIILVQMYQKFFKPTRNKV